MPVIATDDQKGFKCQCVLQPVTAAGNAAKVDGVPVWAVSDPTVLALENIAPDGMSCDAVILGVVGTSQITAVADADLGAGVREITAVGEIQVKAAEAVGLNLTVGSPTAPTP